MPLLAVLANRGRKPRYRRNMLLPMIAGGVAAGVSGAVANRLLHNGKRRSRRNSEGFYVMSRTQSVAWCATRAEADNVAKRLNYRGGTVHTVVPAGRLGTTGRIVAAHRRNPLTRREAAHGLTSARRDYRLGTSYPKGSSRRKFLLGRASGKAAMVADLGQGQRTRYIASSFETKAYARQNPGSNQNTITLPFKQGRKYSVESVARWVETHGTPAMKKRFALSLAQYKRFHKGSMPKFITYQTYKMGSHPGISDVEFGVSEGREWMAAYQVPKSSGKWVDAASGGRYVHAHGDSEIDVDVKKPVNLKKLPLRFHTPDGKAVGVIPSSNVKIGEWYEG
jgi:hypothetical protein